MTHYTVTISDLTIGRTRFVVTPASDECEALADAIEALDPWGEAERQGLISAFSSANDDDSEEA